MKKLLMITVVLALVSGAAFAQVSGDFFAASTFIQGNTGKQANGDPNDMTMGGGNAEAKWGIRFGEGAASGRIVYRLHDDSLWGWFAWRPIEQLRIKYGFDRDGEYGAAQITGWGFNAGAKDLVAYSDYGGGLYMNESIRSPSWFYGFGDSEGYSLIVSVFPVDGLRITAGIPQFGMSGGSGGSGATGSASKIDVQLAKIFGNVEYKIEDVGTANLAFQGRGGLADGVYATPGWFFASFFLTALKEQGVGEFDLGFRMELPWKNASDQDNGGEMRVGLGYRINIEAFQLKVRLGAQLPGGKAAGVANEDIRFAINVLPQYKLEAFTFYFQAGLGMHMPKTGDSNMAWFINPYISVPIGGATFWAGLKVDQQASVGTDDQKRINWAVPFGFSANY